MSISNCNIIDGIGINEEQNAIVLLLCDHLLWEGVDAPKVSDHLVLLQKKINTYVSFLGNQTYKQKYPNLEVKMAVINIRFQYPVPESCDDFLKNEEERLAKVGIILETYVG